MKTNKWENRIRYMISELSPPPSQLKYICSVWDQIEKNSEVYPTKSQRNILDRLWRHLNRVKAQEEVLECEEHI